MPKVTYEGPANAKDVSTFLEIPSEKQGGEPTRLPKGVEVDVTDAVAKAAAKVEGHNVVVNKSGQSGSGS